MKHKSKSKADKILPYIKPKKCRGCGDITPFYVILKGSLLCFPCFEEKR